MDEVTRDPVRVSLTVTIVNNGGECISREFVLDVAGSAGPDRSARELVNAVRDDANTWVNAQRPKPQRVPVSGGIGGPAQLNPWQRFLLSLAGLANPVTSATVTVFRRQTIAEAEATEIGDGAMTYTAAASISVSSEVCSETVSLGGNTNGSPYRLAEGLVDTVVGEMRTRLFDRIYVKS